MRGGVHSRANPDGPQKIELTARSPGSAWKRWTRNSPGKPYDSWRSKKEDKPFFLWWNSTRMHIWTQLKAE